MPTATHRGALAQLVERLTHNQKVAGSNPVCNLWHLGISGSKKHSQQHKEFCTTQSTYVLQKRSVLCVRVCMDKKGSEKNDENNA